jgi:hypothetical protein
MGLCFVSIYFAARRQDGWSALIVALATCLKPQLGIWILGFYMFRQRWSIVLPAAAVGAIVGAIALLRMPLTPAALLHNYSANLHYWFAPGGMNDFSTANPFRFELLNAQVLFQPLVHSATVANVAAWSFFAIGVAVWTWATLRHSWFNASSLRSTKGDELLALSSLLALGILPVYHRSYEASIALLPLAWVIRNWKRAAGVVPFTLAIAFMLAPAQSAIVRAAARLSPSTLNAPFWNLVVCAYGTATVLFLNFTVLTTLVRFTNEGSEKADTGIATATSFDLEHHAGVLQEQ